jgi:hypothetical protein
LNAEATIWVSIYCNKSKKSKNSKV